MGKDGGRVHGVCRDNERLISANIMRKVMEKKA